MNRKRYIGQTCQVLRKRIRAHISNALNGKSKTFFAQAIRKYGENAWAWQTVMECATSDEADRAEAELIRLLNTHCSGRRGYNQSVGGKSRRGFRHKPETLAKFQGRKPWNKGTKSVAVAWNKGKEGWTVRNPERQQELKEKLANEMRGNKYAIGNTSQRKAVVCIETGVVYESAYAACEAITGKFARSTISDVCRGKKKTAYGYTWRFKEEAHVND